MRRKGRAIANRDWKYNRIRDRNKQVVREVFGKNLFEYFSEEDLKKLNTRTRKMLENNTGTLKKCIKCQRVIFIYKKDIAKFSSFFIHKYGGWCCKPCHTGHELPKEEDRPAQKIFAVVYEKWKKNQYQFNGVKVYTL